MVDIEDNFKVVYNGGRVTNEEGYHQPDKASGSMACGCDNTTRKGAYRDVTVEYRGRTYYFYHQTAIVVKLDDNRILINNGGYTTKSTRERINILTPSSVEMHQRDNQWYLEVGDEEREFNRSAIIMLTEEPQIVKE